MRDNEFRQDATTPAAQPAFQKGQLYSQLCQKANSSAAKHWNLSSSRSQQRSRRAAGCFGTTLTAPGI
jgi:hypothetical protein